MTTVEASTDEAVGSLMRRIHAHAGEDTYLSVTLGDGNTLASVHHLNPSRFPAHKINQAAGCVVVSRHNGSQMALSTGRATPLEALTEIAAWLELPDGE